MSTVAKIYEYGTYSLCTLCCKRFVTLEQCLGNEIIEHSLRLNARSEVSHALANSDDGEELDALLNVFLINSEEYNTYVQIFENVHKLVRDVGKFDLYLYGSLVTKLALKSK